MEVTHELTNNEAVGFLLIWLALLTSRRDDNWLDKTATITAWALGAVMLTIAWGWW